MQTSSSPEHRPAATDRKLWIDTIRAAACLLVILLHSAAFYVNNSGLGSLDWNWANAVDAFSRACVPLFFMISGYLFLGSRAPKLRHILRVVSALAVYSAIAILAIWIFGGTFPMAKLMALPYQPAFYHLWYLYALIGIYLLASIITLRAPVTWATLAMLLVLMVVLNDAGLAPEGSRVALDGKSIIYLLLAISGYVLGHLLPTLDATKKVHASRAALVLYVLCATGSTYMTHQASLAAGAFVPTYFDYTHPLVIGAAFSAFTWLHLFSPPKALSRIIETIANNSLAIYGVHAIILVFARAASRAIDAPAYLEIPATFLSVLAASYVVARALRHIDRDGYFT